MHSARTFGLVEDMGRVLDVKEKTRGRNTDQFGDMNLHTELDPRRKIFATSGPALVHEAVMTTQSPDDFPISVTDSELAIFTNEQFSQEVFRYADE
jgi:hypothetical protein